MSKKSAIVIVILAILIALGGLLAWTIFLSPKAENGQAESGGIRDIIFGFFPESSPTTDDHKPTTEGSGTTTDKTPDEDVPPDTGVPLPAPVIRQITTSPTAGFIFTDDKKEGISVRYMEKESGHTYTAPLKVITKTRLTNTTIPRVREAVWLPGGERVIAQYLEESEETIKSFYGEVKPKITPLGVLSEGTLEGKFLNDNLTELTSHPTLEKIFYLLEDNTTEGIVAERDGSKATRVFSSIIREWLPQWVTTNTIFLTTKASGRSPGFLIALNTANGVETEILQNISGLTTNVSPKADKLLYGRSVANGVELYVYDIKSRVETKLPLASLPEKCAWDPSNTDVIFCGVPRRQPSGLYPDSWYKGLTTFEDGLWKINVKTSEASVVGNFRSVTEDQFDIIKPSVSKDGGYVVFVNKHDYSLWSVKVK